MKRLLSMHEPLQDWCVDGHRDCIVIVQRSWSFIFNIDIVDGRSEGEKERERERGSEG